jgi:MoxR-like ATPase
VTEEVELDIYNNYIAIGDVRNTVKQVLTYSDIIGLQDEAEKVFIHPELVNAIVNIVQGSRKHPEITLGCSTRGGIIFIKCLKAWALVNQRNFVIEDDIRAIAQPVLHHRLIFRNREASRSALQQVIDRELERLSKLRIAG